MKRFSLLILAFTIITISSCKNEPDPIKELSILEGYWTMEKGEFTIVEFWKRVNAEGFSGGSFIVNGIDTNITELLSIVEESGVVFYIPTVFGQNENKPVKFRLTEHSNFKFVFENSLHDFPKKITYEFSSDTAFTAIVEGGKHEVDKQLFFNFKKAKKRPAK